MRSYNKAREKKLSKSMEGNTQKWNLREISWFSIKLNKLYWKYLRLDFALLVCLVVGIIVYNAIEYISTILQCYKKVWGTKLMSAMESAALTQTRSKLTEIRN